MSRTIRTPTAEISVRIMQVQARQRLWLGSKPNPVRSARHPSALQNPARSNLRIRPARAGIRPSGLESGADLPCLWSCYRIVSGWIIGRLHLEGWLEPWVVVLHLPFGRRLGGRFFQGGLGLHLHSFVIATKPQSFLIHSLKSVPWVLTADKQDNRIPAASVAAQHLLHRFADLLHRKRLGKKVHVGNVDLAP